MTTVDFEDVSTESSKERSPNVTSLKSLDEIPEELLESLALCWRNVRRQLSSCTVLREQDEKISLRFTTNYFVLAFQIIVRKIVKLQRESMMLPALVYL